MRTIINKNLNKPAIIAKPFTDKDSLRRLMLLSLLSLGMLIFANQLYAAEVNPYAANYKQQNTNQLKSLQANPEPEIFVSNHKEDDNISMLENGYDMIGSSGFSATETSSDLALAHAKKINADTVLVYRKYESAKTASAKLQLIKEAAKAGGEIDPNDLEEEPTQYHYYASYWAKLPMPLLGVHIIKLKQKVEEDAQEVVKEEPGLKIIAVIKESPAAKANIVKGDTLLKIGEVALASADDLFAAVKRYAGQKVPVELQHNGVEVKTTVALNLRQ
ncbi:MAG: PDZ domain-containing protein [Methylotenera sp.]|nr:PDZ domain-containing protein [Methylotenera sp.]MDO9234309.1 PDZ domain-containing protein [Methylotenera sp.]MDO9388925.1 PDZ domain-containing protein [Methylotenera sp.]MDP2101196.1 PDZ domain-containing protein [Methylotenera sp.]MDP2280960.1 PDZ domain-containing protein [Methylotenera sp.]